MAGGEGLGGAFGGGGDGGKGGLDRGEGGLLAVEQAGERHGGCYGRKAVAMPVLRFGPPFGHDDSPCCAT